MAVRQFSVWSARRFATIGSMVAGLLPLAACNAASNLSGAAPVIPTGMPVTGEVLGTGSVRVALTLPGGAGKLVAVGTVVRQEPGRTAVTFTNLSSRDQQSLRKLAAGHALAA